MRGISETEQPGSAANIKHVREQFIVNGFSCFQGHQRDSDSYQSLHIRSLVLGDEDLSQE